MTLSKPSIRLGLPADLGRIVPMSAGLWPHEPVDGLEAHVAAILAGTPRSTLPLVLFVAEIDGDAVGFIEVGLRSHAEGCDARRPVGFIEGWYVHPDYRLRGIGRALVARAEQWSREQGAVEIASDTWIDHQLSIDAHQALGYEVAERAVHFRKKLSR